MEALPGQQSRAPVVPGDVLLHPVALVAIALLIANDHFLKVAYPGFVTGKLSDFAGLAFFPLFLLAVWETLSELRRRPSVGDQRALLAAVAITALVFAAIKTVPVANQTFSLALGTLQWVAGLLPSLLASSRAPIMAPVAIALDPTDLVALPAVLVGYVVGASRRRR